MYSKIDSNPLDSFKNRSSSIELANIKNSYLLDNGMIPVKKDKYWGAFDKNGNQVLDFVYVSQF